MDIGEFWDNLEYEEKRAIGILAYKYESCLDRAELLWTYWDYTNPRTKRRVEPYIRRAMESQKKPIKTVAGNT